MLRTLVRNAETAKMQAAAPPAAFALTGAVEWRPEPAAIDEGGKSCIGRIWQEAVSSQ